MASIALTITVACNFEYFLALTLRFFPPQPKWGCISWKSLLKAGNAPIFPNKSQKCTEIRQEASRVQFYGWDTTENWNSQQRKGSGGQWTKNMLLLLTLLSGRHFHKMSSLAPWCWMVLCFFLRIWSLENRRSYGARKKHKRLPRLAMKCFRPCFFILVSHCQAMQWPDWDLAKFSFSQLWGSSFYLCVSVNHQANLKWHTQKLYCNRRKASFWMSAAGEHRDRVEELLIRINKSTSNTRIQLP